MTVGKRTRFEVFKRDSFTCQYCGKQAPDVVLHVDHIQPVSDGGDDDILNLVTSCRDCNLGKSNVLLSDDTAIAKQKRQLDELQERREQIEMMLEWQRSLLNLESEETEQANQFWQELIPGSGLTEHGIHTLKSTIHKYGFAETLESMRISAAQYLVWTSSGPTDESIRKTFDYISRIAKSRQKIARKPYLSDLYYIRNVARKHCPNYFRDIDALNLLEKAYSVGYAIDDLRDIAYRAHNWTSWANEMDMIIAAAGAHNGMG